MWNSKFLLIINVSYYCSSGKPTLFSKNLTNLLDYWGWQMHYKFSNTWKDVKSNMIQNIYLHFLVQMFILRQLNKYIFTHVLLFLILLSQTSKSLWLEAFQSRQTPALHWRNWQNFPVSKTVDKCQKYCQSWLENTF